MTSIESLQIAVMGTISKLWVEESELKLDKLIDAVNINFIAFKDKEAEDEED